MTSIEQLQLTAASRSVLRRLIRFRWGLGRGFACARWLLLRRCGLAARGLKGVLNVGCSHLLGDRARKVLRGHLLRLTTVSLILRHQ